MSTRATAIVIGEGDQVDDEDDPDRPQPASVERSLERLDGDGGCDEEEQQVRQAVERLRTEPLRPVRDPADGQ